MQTIISRTLGGLSTRYYVRQLFFGAFFPLAFIVMQRLEHQGGDVDWPMWCFLLVNTLLYPYARFVYEGVVGFIMGENFFFVNAGVLLFTKFFTMGLCWLLAVVMAPIGMAYLYFRQARPERDAQPG